MQTLQEKKKAEASDEADSEGGEDEVYYDEMEYGDELNDQEEREYKKEKFAAKYEMPKRDERTLNERTCWKSH